jgi:hypothetical protein
MPMALSPPQAAPEWNHTPEEMKKLAQDTIAKDKAVKDKVGASTPEECTFSSVSCFLLLCSLSHPDNSWFCIGFCEALHHQIPCIPRSDTSNRPSSQKQRQHMSPCLDLSPSTNMSLPLRTSETPPRKWRDSFKIMQSIRRCVSTSSLRN